MRSRSHSSPKTGKPQKPNPPHPNFQAGVEPFPIKETHSFIHSFIVCLFIENLLCDSLYPKFWGGRREENKTPGLWDFQSGRRDRQREVSTNVQCNQCRVLHTFGHSVSAWLFRDDRGTSPWGPEDGGETNGPREPPKASVSLPAKVGEAKQHQPGMCQDAWAPALTPLPVSPAVCQPPCQNRGSCSRPQLCVCRSGFRGARCEEVIPEEEFDPQNKRPAPRRSAEGSPNPRRSGAARESTTTPRTRSLASQLPPAR